MSSDFAEIQALVNLFQTPQTEENSESEQEDAQDTAETGNTQKTERVKGQKTKKINPYAKLEPKERKFAVEDPDDIEEFLSDSEENKASTADWKKCPEWDISYRQQVNASDVFLQMGPKNPSTASCEDMLVTIHLPGDDRHNIDLKILKERLQLNSPQYYLDIPLPHPVDPQLGKAEYDTSQEKLIVTLKMDREFDFMNF